MRQIAIVMAEWTWYYATVVMTPSILILWNSCCGHFYYGLSSWIFQVIADKFDVLYENLTDGKTTQSKTRVKKRTTEKIKTW